MFLMFVSPTVSLKNKVSTRLDLTIRSKGITRSNRPNLNKMLQKGQTVVKHILSLSYEGNLPFHCYLVGWLMYLFLT